jgi:hypothetical protein
MRCLSISISTYFTVPPCYIFSTFGCSLFSSAMFPFPLLTLLFVSLLICHCFSCATWTSHAFFSFTLLPYFLTDMQYKFFVDGEWRHDERQPTATGDYGVVNTIRLTRDVNQINTVLSPTPPGSRVNMDVDNENFQCAVSITYVSKKFHNK